MSFQSWRGTAGMVMPTMRPGAPEEVIRLLPDGVGVITLYLNIERGDEGEFEDSLPHYEAEIARLSRAGCEVIHPAGAPPFMLLGYEGEKLLIAAWEARHGAAFFTAGSNHVAAFEALGVNRIVGASYSALQNRIVKDYLGQAGVDVLAMEPLEAPFKSVGQISPTALYGHVRRLFLAQPRAEAIYVQGSGWRTLGIIEAMEQDFGVPVVHAVASKAWEIQKRLKVREPRSGYGRLLADLPGY